MLGIELGHAFDGLRIGTSVKVDYFLIGVLEGQNDRICGESSELRVQFLTGQSALGISRGCIVYCVTAVTYIEKVQLIGVSSADARCEKQQVTLQP